MWSLFFKNTRLLILTICLIFTWGISSFQSIPRMEDPELSQPAALITTRFPGASADRVESLVTEKIEQELFEIAELKMIESNSRPGVSIIRVEIKDEILPENKEQIWSLVRDKITDATSQLPPEVLEPQYQDREARASTIIAALTWDLESPINYAVLSRLSKELENELRTLPGTDKVDFFGIPNEEIIVEVSSANLAALGLTVQELSQQIRMSDAKVAAGYLRNSNDLPIEVQTEIDSLERIRQIPLFTVSDDSGQFSRLDDIAIVTKNIEKPPTDLSLVDGKPAVVLSVFMESERRIDQWAETARQTFTEFQERLPEGVSLQLIFDQSLYVENRLNSLFKNLLLGVVFVFCTTLILMGWKSALAVGSALPLSVLMVFGGMKLLEIPLHQMSVTGLVIALGLLIDNSIVVVNEVQQEINRGTRPRQAISTKVKYLSVPLLASNLTTILAFMPIAILPGSTGEFVGSIALTVILALFSSLLLSFTVVPALSGIIHQKQEQQYQSKRQNMWLTLHSKGFSHPILIKFYSRTLRFILGRPLLGVLLALILPITGFAMASSLEEQFFSPAERNQILVEFELEPYASIEQTKLNTIQARKFFLKHPEVEEVNWFLGKNAPKIWYNLVENRNYFPNYAQGIVKTRSADDNQELINVLQKELNQAFPSVRVMFRELQQGQPFAAPIELRIYGSDIEILRKIGDRTRAKLSQIADVIHTRASLSDTLPKLGLQINEEQARISGLDNTKIAEQLDTSLEGFLGGSILEETEELPVRVRLANSERGNLDHIASLDLLSKNTASDKNSTSVSLSSLGQFELMHEIATIKRRNGRRVNTVEGFIRAGILPSKVLEEFKLRLQTADLQIPSGYSLEFGGESAERNEAVGNLMSTISVLLVLMLAILILSFNSLRLAGIILFVGVCSVGLGLFSLWCFGYPLGFMAILGIFGLIGIAINDSILVLTALHSNPQVRKGDRKAMEKVIISSTRHVLTTTFTTIASFVPLILNGGMFWPPLAVSIAGGVGGATIIALCFVPCIYLLSRGWSSSIKNRRFRSKKFNT